MDFDRLLPSLLEKLEQSSIRYAVIGGFALGILGVPRALGRDAATRAHLPRIGASPEHQSP